MLILSSADAFFPIEGAVPSSLLPWLMYQDSLTEKLREKSGDARLQVLAEYWGAPDWWDKHVLHCNNEAVFHREILMWAWEKPCWHARTIIPYTTYHAHRALFSRLDKESLGTLIFNTPDIKRINMLYYPINEQSIEYSWLNPLMLNHEKIAWVRLSTFIVADRLPFFLTETLLSGLMEYLH